MRTGLFTVCSFEKRGQLHRAPHVMSVSELHELPSANIGSNLPEGNFKAPSKNLRLASPLMFCCFVRFFCFF